MSARFSYRPEVLEQLLVHGLRPSSRTPPTRLRTQLNDLYRFELRRLRGQLLRGAFPRHEYSGRVIALRTRYFLLSVPVEQWVTTPNGH